MISPLTPLAQAGAFLDFKGPEASEGQHAQPVDLISPLQQKQAKAPYDLEGQAPIPGALVIEHAYSHANARAVEERVNENRREEGTENDPSSTLASPARLRQGPNVNFSGHDSVLEISPEGVSRPYQQWHLADLLTLTSPLSPSTCERIGRLNCKLKNKGYFILLNACTVGGLFDSFVDPTSRVLSNFLGHPGDAWFEAFLSTCIKGVAKGTAGLFAWKQVKSRTRASKEVKLLMDNLYEDYCNIASSLLSHYSLETAAGANDREKNRNTWRRNLKPIKNFKLEEMRKEMIKLGMTTNQAARLIQPLQHTIAIVDLPLDADVDPDNVMKVKWHKIQSNLSRIMMRKGTIDSRKTPSEGSSDLNLLVAS